MQSKVEGQAYPVDKDSKEDKEIKDLVDWKNPPTLKELKEDLSSAKSEVDHQVGKVKDWLNALNAEGKYAAPEIEGRSRMSVRLVRKQVEWRCPSLTEPFLSSSKIFEVAPRTWEDKAAAEQNELILNYQFKNKLNSVNLMDNIVRTAATEGTAILRSYWKYKEDKIQETEDSYDAVPTFDSDYQAQIQQLAEQAQQDPAVTESLEEPQRLAVETFMETGGVLEYRLKESKAVDVIKVIANHPCAEVCNVEDVFPDPSCKGDLDKAKFVVYRYDSCLASLKEDGRYSNLDTLEEEIIANEQKSSKSDGSKHQFQDKARKSIEVFEYWGYYDLDDTGILYSFVASWVGNTLIQMERSPYPDNKLPFTFIPLIPVKGSLYGEPDAELIKDNQLIMSATMRGAIDLFGRSANGQMGIAKNFLDQTNTQRFNNGENYMFNQTMDPARALFTHKFNEIPQSVFNLMGYLSNEAESFSGVKSFSQGVSGDSLGKTAKGARNALDATAKRDASILRRIAEGLVNLAYKFQTMNSVFLTEQDVVRLTNSEFVQVDPENLNGDFDLSIDISTAESDEQKANDLLMMLQTGQSTFPLEFTQQILSEIAKLKKLPELAQFVKSYKPEPDPVQQKLQELEIAKIEAEIAKVQAETQETLAKAGVHQMEQGVRIARQENMQAATDKTNIVTYKDANGITQEEKLQLEEVKRKAKAQEDLRKHDLDMQKKDKEHNLNLRMEGAKNDLMAMSEDTPSTDPSGNRKQSS